jgi:hypothetical protein
MVFAELVMSRNRRHTRRETRLQHNDMAVDSQIGSQIFWDFTVEELSKSVNIPGASKTCIPKRRQAQQDNHNLNSATMESSGVK